jgi:hypothetical protein
VAYREKSREQILFLLLFSFLLLFFYMRGGEREIGGGVREGSYLFLSVTK